MTDIVERLDTFRPQHLIGLASTFRAWEHAELWGRPEEAEHAAREVETAYLDLTAQAAEIDRLRAALGRLEKAATDYGIEYLLDEHETPELCGIDARQHAMIVELADASRAARAALHAEDRAG